MYVAFSMEYSINLFLKKAYIKWIYLQIKAECPLCKQTFKSIIHNVISMDKYEEYKVEPYRRLSNWANIANQFEQFLLTSLPYRYVTKCHLQINEY